jgi:hypothetical protein
MVMLMSFVPLAWGSLTGIVGLAFSLSWNWFGFDESG